MYRKIFVALISLSVVSCATTKIHQAEKRMYEINIQALNAQKIGNYELAKEKFLTCIELDLGLQAITKNRARRWCQNNLIAMMNSCTQRLVCDKKKALLLAKDLYEYNESAKRDDHYAVNVAEAYFVNNQYDDAIRVLEKLLTYMNDRHHMAQSLKSKLEKYRFAREKSSKK